MPDNIIPIDCESEVNVPDFATAPRMVSIQTASDLTGVSYDAIRNLCLRNEIVFLRTGRKYLINLNKFYDFLNGGDNHVIH